jgi:hypothetical protein
MALTERTEIDLIEVCEPWHIKVRQATIIEKDGVQVARTFHRWGLVPDMDISTQEPKVQAVANAVWTQEIIDAYKASKEQASKY